jgi:hypothetical protein
VQKEGLSPVWWKVSYFAEGTIGSRLVEDVAGVATWKTVKGGKRGMMVICGSTGEHLA